ncbi:ATP-binding cassette domain-containing protein [Xylanimonas ulmi]|uniref:ABC-2 type transport system ATP-binding protein n=1 Tax=Xylanimonas ulmi TaxID=228973 RepID=A0A4Q7M1S9_9MICO|nr:ABC transporter ATP-binding protein [Xylanibacterium ulmi]RZS60348.1 ABC-2 type transport system ATP-binding protein [Xylanibacterium ulmi]
MTTLPPFAARLDAVTVRYGRARAVTTRLGVPGLDARTQAVDALDDATLTIRPGAITGVLGRNGAGKTTMLQLLAGYARPTSGSVVVGPDGQEENPWENPWITSATQLVRESGDLMNDERVKVSLCHVADLRPDWDADLAGRLLDLFEIDTRRKPQALSRGKRSALGATIGLASRAPLTIFDEVYLGMDAPTRYAFYDAILADYAEHPRTILLSSHLVEEVERLFEDVVVLHRGRVLLAEPADTMRERGHSLTGPAPAVERLAAGHRVLHRQQLGGTAQVTLEGPPDVAAARAEGVDVGAVPLQDLFVHLTANDHAAPKGAAR